LDKSELASTVFFSALHDDNVTIASITNVVLLITF
jgi:hypothetical protein